MKLTSNKPIRIILRVVFWVVFLVLLVYAAETAYRTVRVMVQGWEVTSLGELPGFNHQPPTPTPTQPAGPLPTAAPGEPEPTLVPVDNGPTWDGAKRVTVLVMGIDYRDWESGEGAPRTDTMILLSVDPLAKTAGILSIPRDLYVSIPGFENDRINTAYRYGELYKLPGGGPELARKTVEGVVGVPVDYYAVVDFSTFVRVIDELDGLKLDIPEPIKVDPIGEAPPRWLEPGIAVYPGDLVLAYARARNTEGGDFDRAQRQQQVILAIKRRVLEFNLYPLLLAKAPILYQEMASGVRTNMNLEQAIALARLALDISDENIRRGVIGKEHVNFFTTPENEEVLKPMPDQIRVLRDQVFGTANLASPLTSLSEAEQAQTEAASIYIYNGSGRDGLAARTAEYLSSLGITIPGDRLGNANQAVSLTSIYDYTGNPYTLNFLVETLNIQPQRVFLRYDPASSVDVEVVLGSDWAASNPMP